MKSRDWIFSLSVPAIIAPAASAFAAEAPYQDQVQQQAVEVRAAEKTSITSSMDLLASAVVPRAETQQIAATVLAEMEMTRYQLELVMAERDALAAQLQVVQAELATVTALWEGDLPHLPLPGPMYIGEPIIAEVLPGIYSPVPDFHPLQEDE
jgi:hypothetical protein